MEKRKSGTKNPAIIEVHIGNLLAEKIKEQRLTHSAVARKIKRPSSAIKPLLARPSMQAYLLWELSIALQYDFFSAISTALLSTHAHLKNESANTELKKENELLKMQLEIWKEAAGVKK